MSLSFCFPVSASLRSAESFEVALMSVSELLSEAVNHREGQQEQEAAQWFALAEEYAFSTGYLELVRLVWIYQTPPTQSAIQFS